MLQEEIDTAVKTSLSLKAEYKAATGKDWKPGATPAPTSTPSTGVAPSSAGDGDKLNEMIVEQGNKVRDIKSKKAPKVSKMEIWVLSKFS